VNRSGVLAVVPLALGCYVVRTILVYALRRRAPSVAAAVDRWWAWVPLVVVVVALGFVHPLIGIAAAVACYLFMTSSRGRGSPFRPRR
jgi:uncharacterized membrane protein